MGIFPDDSAGKLCYTRVSQTSQAGAPMVSRPPDTAGQRVSSTKAAMPSDIQAPGPLKVMRNTTSIMARNTGRARYLWVATASMRSVRVGLPSRLLLRTALRTTRSTNR